MLRFKGLLASTHPKRYRRWKNENRTFTWASLSLASLMSACGRNMYDQPKYRVFDASSLLPNGASTQSLQANTVPRTIAVSDNRYSDTSFYSGLGATGL
ncbi:MAG: hypothetical protein R2865_04645 [Deinococcales bacterium]